MIPSRSRDDRRTTAVDLSSVFGVAAAAALRRRTSEAAEQPQIVEDDVHVPTDRMAPDAPVRTPQPLGAVEVRDRRHIDLLLLAAAATGPANGRELADLVRERSDGLFAVPLPVVTRRLHRLTTNRLVQVTGDRGAPRRYTLTPLGERVLATRRREWEAFSGGFARVLDAAE
jgi:DNA-binding PadR family transcriptional regulator